MTDWEVYKSNVDDMEIDTEEEDMSQYIDQNDDGNYNENYYQRQSFSYTPKGKYLKNIRSPNSESFTSDNEEHINHEFLENGQFNEAKYLAFKEKAIEERANLGAGKSHLMNMLFCFWCFYLRDHFENDMYFEFLTCAREDRALGATYGIQCLYRYCSYGLETNWNPEIFETFEDEAMDDYWKGDKYGLEKVKAFLINQKYDFPIPLKPETQRELDKYPTCRSFRESNYNGKNNQRRGSDASRVTFKFGSMPQPKFRPPIPNNNNNQTNQPNQQQQKKKKNRKNKNKNKFNYTPDQNKTIEISEKEKEEMEKKKELEKEMAETKTDVKSLPGIYKPPVCTEENKDLFKLPPQLCRPKYQKSSPKSSAPREWSFGKAQPQSLPKNSSFRRNNKW